MIWTLHENIYKQTSKKFNKPSEISNKSSKVCIMTKFQLESGWSKGKNGNSNKLTWRWHISTNEKRLLPLFCFLCLTGFMFLTQLRRLSKYVLELYANVPSLFCWYYNKCWKGHIVFPELFLTNFALPVPSGLIWHLTLESSLILLLSCLRYRFCLCLVSTNTLIIKWGSRWNLYLNIYIFKPNLSL